MNYESTSHYSQNISFAPSTSYNPIVYNQNGNNFEYSANNLSAGYIENVSRPYVYPASTESNYTGFSSKSENNYYINTNIGASPSYNTYNIDHTYQSQIKPQEINNTYQQNNANNNIIYRKAKILPTKYLPIKFTQPKVINSTNEFSNTQPINISYTATNNLSQTVPDIESTQNIISTTRTTENNNFYISNPQISTHETPQISAQTNSSYLTEQIYTEPISSNLTSQNSYSQEISSYSNPQTSSYSSIQYNKYNYENQNEEQNINSQLARELVKFPENIDVNSYNNSATEINTNLNPINNIIINESDNLHQENEVIESNIDSYGESKPVLVSVNNNNYFMNEPETNQDQDDNPIYHSYIYKSPEITYRKNLFSPIQSPLANYETLSFNGDENLDIEEMLKLKEENKMFKQKISDLENKYAAEKAEAIKLRIEVDQLSPLKEKISEIDSLKAQLLELNKLKAKLNQLKPFKPHYEEINDNESKEEKYSVNRIQNVIESTETKTNEIKSALNEIENDEESEDEFGKIEFKDENEPEYVKGEIIHSLEELTMIIKKINTNNEKLTLNLLYKATADSDRAAVFHKKCDNAKSSIVLIETDKGRRFGGYTSVNWKGKGLNKKDVNSFVFSLDNMKIYKNIRGEKAIGCYPKFGPIFLGCQIRIYDEAFEKGGSTFKKGINFDTDEDYTLTGGDRVFKVKEIEVYEVIAQ